MHTDIQFDGYVPKVSKQAIFVLRRYAWFKKQPMTDTLDQLILNIVPSLDAKLICSACKGVKPQCENCPFKKGTVAHKANKSPKATTK
jgi:hypothetical protein